MAGQGWHLYSGSVARGRQHRGSRLVAQKKKTNTEVSIWAGFPPGVIGKCVGCPAHLARAISLTFIPVRAYAALARAHGWVSMVWVGNAAWGVLSQPQCDYLLSGEFHRGTFIFRCCCWLDTETASASTPEGSMT